MDCGCHGDFKNLVRQIDDLGVRLADISLLILTHVHFDHCGCAAELRKFGIPVMASAAGQDFLLRGVQENPQIQDFPSLVLQSFQRRFKFFGFPGVALDVPVEHSCSLEDFGVQGEVLQTPGHTKNSLSIVLEDQSACIGDLLMGGYLGLPPAWRPAIHPSSFDVSTCVRSVRRLRADGIQRFFVGHGDILDAHDIDFLLKDFQDF